ncbi:MAG: radical SAM protein [bacterium]
MIAPARVWPKGSGTGNAVAALERASWLLEAVAPGVVWLEGAPDYRGGNARGIPARGIVSREAAAAVETHGGPDYVIRMDPGCAPLEKPVLEDMLDDLRLLDSMGLAVDMLALDPAVFDRRDFQIFTKPFLRRVAGGERFSISGCRAPVSKSGAGVPVYNYRPSFDVAAGVWPEVKSKIDDGQYPFMWQVSPGEICNLNCHMCPFHGRDSDDEVTEFYEKWHTGLKGAVLELDDFKPMLDEVAGLFPVKRVVLTGFGEPLLHGDFFKFADAVVKKGLKCSLTTNGTLLDDERIGRLVRSGIDMVSVSIDAATGESYARIRKGGPPLEHLERRVRRLCRLGHGHGMHIGVGFVVQELNRGETGAFIERWRDDADSVSCWQKNRLFGFEGPWIHGVFPKRKVCMALLEGLYTNADGGMAPCCGLLPIDAWKYQPGRLDKLRDEKLYPFIKSNFTGPLPAPCARCENWSGGVAVTAARDGFNETITPVSISVARRRPFVAKAWNRAKNMMTRWFQ